MHMLITIGAAAAVAATLAGCGNNPLDRGLSGAALGAGAGAVGAALIDEDVGRGAILGGAVGAGAGILTNPSQFNLGAPVWYQ
jgi:osmotically inducible lipoprotein OsmB